MGINKDHHTDAVTQAGLGMDGAQLPEQERQGPTVSEGQDGPTEIDASSIPIQGDEDTANRFAKEAYGDQDNDGNPDIPNVPFPG